MKTTLMIPASLCFVFFGLGSARADVAVGVSAQLMVAPTLPVPAFVPAVPVQPPPPPVRAYAAPAVAVTTPGMTGGQWVYTTQYGWLYMPFESRYVVTHGAGPYAYVYYPSYGWRWVASPWVVGVGPYPHFGARGPHAYGWFEGLHRAGHPMAAHYARPTHPPTIVPRATTPVRAVHAGRPVAPHAAARPAIPTRKVTSPPMGGAGQRNHAAPTKVAFAPRGSRR